MRTLPSCVLCAALLAVLASCRVAEPKEITTVSLLAEMSDLAAMAEFPEPAYTCRQFSSYDRGAKSPTENWFANNDRGHFVRIEKRNGRNEHVMMDAAGPGAIVRIWSANPKGTLRFYLDGAETPALEVPMADLLGGKVGPIKPPLGGMRARGWNLYFPIPYAKHCKVTNDQGGFYYHVNYRTYAPGTKVVTFAKDQLETWRKPIAAAAAALASPRKAGATAAGKEATFEATIKPGDTQTLATMNGPAAIVRFIARVRTDDAALALRRAILTMTFDGDETVSVPLGDFFGTAPGVNPYESLSLGMTKDGEMWCHWAMPFRKSATVTVRNTGDEPLKLSGNVVVAARKWTKRSMHFHAKWRTDLNLPTRPMRDWNYLAATGKGVFAGVSFQIANPVPGWWGEGDEKIYVDGETFPSHFGTGTEDYYGYAWGCPARFTHAYHSQTGRIGPGTKGVNSLNRWHILDRIPFTENFRFDMELWHWKAVNVNMTVTAYWYARPGGTDGFKPIRPADLAAPFMPDWGAARIGGAVEGERMRIIKRTGTVSPQQITACSGGSHLWWRGGKPGDKLVLGFRAPKAGTFRVHARFVKAIDYGISQVSINGKRAGLSIDLYNNGVVPSKQMDLGAFEIRKGENTITVEIVGANPKAKKAYMFGLDYVLLKPSQ